MHDVRWAAWQEWDKIWTINKKIIDPVCPRHTAIADDGRVKLHLTNGPQSPEVISVPKNKKHPPAGVKATTKTQVPRPPPLGARSLVWAALTIRTCDAYLWCNVSSAGESLVSANC